MQDFRLDSIKSKEEGAVFACCCSLQDWRVAGLRAVRELQDSHPPRLHADGWLGPGLLLTFVLDTFSKGFQQATQPRSPDGGLAGYESDDIRVVAPWRAGLLSTPSSSARLD